LNVADTGDRARDFLKEYGWTWPQLVDTNRSKARRFGVSWQPAVIAIDAKGRIAGVDQSYDRERAWNRLAAKLP
jgi:hypothetical protein